jgi:precorrin-3B C17-methyltransferase
MSEVGQSEKSGSVTIVGIGPGAHEHITRAALEAIADAELVVGYNTYIRLVSSLLQGKRIVRTGMTEEIGRARAAVEAAMGGQRVVVISSGDAGVYGMGSLIMQVLRDFGWQRGQSPTLRLVPGITALSSCGSLVGAPLGHDFCAISLSDLLTPWAIIERRLQAAAEADFVVGLYNPASGRRTKQIVRAQEILSGHREPKTPVALIKSAYRVQQEVILTTLDEFLEYEIGMNTTVIVGSTQSYVFEGYMVTPRGYGNKYTAEGDVLAGQRPAWSLVTEDGGLEGALAARTSRESEACEGESS